ncbi:uncharacterized protein [Macrobrachium rosenbergii]|uniref:uncharacterized protein isoform X2 n=1 Tax=Macrobrachium rosenbergii TaxID=79674 RepID=UPI0034D564FA
MTEKGVTIERSPSGLGMGMFTPHLGGGGSNWDQQQNAIITKITPTNAPAARINTDNQEKERRRKKSGDKNNVGRSCVCGGWIRAGQLEHDLAELKATHNTLLAGLHVQIESLKQKNRDLTFQLLMGPYAGGVKTDVPLSPESDEATSPKNDVPSKVVDSNKAQKEATSSTSLSSTSPVTSNNNSNNIAAAKEKEEPKSEKLSEETLTNGDVTVVRRKLRGRSGRGDPRLVRSLDLELLEEEAHHTRILLEEERAKNKYLTTLVEDLKRSSERDGGTTFPSITAPRYQHHQPEQQQQQQQSQHQQQQQQQQQPQHRGRGRQYGRGRTRQRQHQQQQQQQHERQDAKGAVNGELPAHHQTQSRGGEGHRPASLTRGSGGARHQYILQRDDSRGRSEVTTAQSGGPSGGRDSSQGNRGGRHGRDGSAGDGGGGSGSGNNPTTSHSSSSSSALADQKRGLQNAAQDQEGRPENRQKRNGRGHRRAGRGRPRKDKHNVSAEVPEGGEHHPQHQQQ